MTEATCAQDHILLICTVGGTPPPIIVSLNHWQPARVVFICTTDSRGSAEAALAQAPQVAPHQCDYCDIADHQDLTDCVSRIRRITGTVQNWLGRGPGHKVAVDITGGTKCMSAALALVARLWPCTFTYVGGQQRSKGGVGTVSDGFEQAMATQNPWDALGYQVLENACLLFDQCAFAAAAQRLDNARRAAASPAVRRTLSTFHLLCEAYDAWDCFRHQDAQNLLTKALTNENDFYQTLRQPCADELVSALKAHCQLLPEITIEPPSRELLLDLAANAQRRAQTGRTDDAVARLYRCVEALAQLHLRDAYGIDTSAVPVAKLPESLRSQWMPHAEDGFLKLALQDAYLFLKKSGDPLGLSFYKTTLWDRVKSPLIVRNNSILAHGFAPVSPNTFTQLWTACLDLAGISEDQLTRFPILSFRSAPRGG